MNAQQREDLARFLLGMGDDELLLAHRDSEWTGHAPILEEDIAFGNIALDEMGHALGWYQLMAQLRGEDPAAYPDRLVYHRPADEFRSVQMVELPIGDWASTIVRQYLFDSSERVRLEQLSRSSSADLAELAAKIRSEEAYHLRHLKAWVERLGLGTDESHQRMQNALNELYPYALQLFVPEEAETGLVEAGVLPNAVQVGGSWEQEVGALFEMCGLTVPPDVEPAAVDRRRHTEHLEPLVVELQQVVRQNEGAEW